jgi:hypothetical protein
MHNAEQRDKNLRSRKVRRKSVICYLLEMIFMANTQSFTIPKPLNAA